MSKHKIKELFNIEKGSLQSSKNTEGDFDFVTASSEWKTHESYTHDTEALIFAMGASGSLGRTHYVNGKFITSDLCYILTPKVEYKDKLVLRLYYHYFNFYRREIVKATATGTSKKAINQKNFSNYEIDYIENQVELLKKIEIALPTITILQDSIKRSLVLVKRMEENLYSSAIKGELVEQNPDEESAVAFLEQIQEEKKNRIKEKTLKKIGALPVIKEEEKPYDLPPGWVWGRFSDLGEFTRGKSKHRPRNDIQLFKGGTFPFIQTGDVKTDRLYIENYTKQYNEVGLSQSRLFPKDTLCITIAANIANSSLLGIEACFPDSIVGLVPIHPADKITNMYLNYFIKTIRNELETYAPATAQKNINLGILNEVVVPVPPLEEQGRIVEKVEMLLRYRVELLNKINNSKLEVDNIMKAILKETFN